MKQKFAFRRLIISALFLIAMSGLVWRAFDLHISSQDFLQKQGDARHIRTIAINAHRGNIYDRNGEPLAISSPVDSVWVNPKQIADNADRVPELAKMLSMDVEVLQQRLLENSSREFMYVKRRLAPELAQRVKSLAIEGVYLQREYQRFYPTGEVAAHVLGFTNVDDNGQEGIELAFNEYLSGKPGAKKIIRDRLGRAIDDVERLQAAEPGKDLYLSIDKRLQYIAYRSLKSAVQEHKAKSASAVVLDVETGEVLAMVNQPSFNPNDRSDLQPRRTRNRAITDTFEPGSTMKPLTMAAALDSGQWKPSDTVNTSPGFMRVNNASIKDVRNFGQLSLPAIIYKSSNVGISKIALTLTKEQQWHIYQQFGIGQTTESGFPGEVSGHFDFYKYMSEFERSTAAFGYGLSVTPLQLVRAYSVFADKGVLKPVSFVRQDSEVKGSQVISEKVSEQVTLMMEQVVSKKGTADKAGVLNYRVAGKTGTVHKSTTGGYAEDNYQAVFAGFAPLDKPRLVMVVMVNEPSAGQYYGGTVAGPVFSKVMMNAMRLMDIPPDKLNLGLLDNKQQSGSGTVKAGGRV